MPDDGQMEIDYPQFTVDLSNHVLAGGGPNNLVEESKSFSGDEMFASIRQYLGLPSIQGEFLHQYLVKSGNLRKFELVGLHTLLDGAQVPLRQMAYSIQLLKHSLFSLGHNFGVERTVDVIAAFFEVLRSDGLLKAFQAKAEQAQKEYDDSQNVEPPSQSSMAPGRVLALKYRAYVYQLWLEVVGGNDAGQLRYYLRNLLVFQMIPGIIGQVLESATHGNTVDHTKYADALTLAEQIHQIPRFTEIAKAYRKNAPNYFEFIMIYATERKLEGFDGYHEDTSDLLVPGAEQHRG
ncbi:hypothetical protein H4R35_003959 [Dimargaris xerosporica]|nr:hypothetical protein H4R35_003959 [Dimargaris xerosporica]